LQVGGEYAISAAGPAVTLPRRTGFEVRTPAAAPALALGKDFHRLTDLAGSTGNLH